MIRRLFPIVFSLLYLSAHGQKVEWKPDIQSINLPNSEIVNENLSDIYVDQSGLVWIISFNSIMFYNGKYFEALETDHLSYNTFLRILENEAGMKYVIDFSGRFYFIKNKEVIPYQHNEVVKDLNLRNRHFGYYFDADTNLTISFNSTGLNSISNIGEVTDILDQYQLTLSDRSIRFSNDHKDPFYFAGNRKRQIHERKKPHLFRIFNHDFVLIDSIFFGMSRWFYPPSMIKQSNGNWLFSNGEGYLIEFNDDSIMNLIQYPDPILRLFKEKDEIFMSTVGSGIHVHHKEIKEQPIDTLLENSSMMLVAKDLEGGFWFYGEEGGLKYLINRSLLFSNYELGCLIERGKNEIVVATADELQFFSDSSIHKPFKSVPLGAKPLDLHYNKQDDTYWIGFKEKLASYKDGELRFYSTSSFEDPSGAKFYFASTYDTSLYQIAGFAGEQAFIIDLDGNLNVLPKRKHRIEKAIFTAQYNLFKDDKDELYVEWLNAPKERLNIEDSLFSIKNSIQMDSLLIISQLNAGLVVLSENLISSLNYQGIPIRNAHLVKEDSRSFWAFTKNGSFSIHYPGRSKEYTIEQYEALPYFPIKDIEIVANTLYVTYKKMPLAKIDLDELELASKKLPNFKIEYIETADEKLFLPIDEVTLSATKNRLSIYWEYFSYQNKSIEVRYRLSNPDQWRETNEKKIIFNSLPYGESQFLLQVKYPYGDWQTVLDLPIKVQYPWYLNIWIILMITFLVVILIVFINRLVVRQRLKENQLVIEKIESDLKVFRSQMNPHFISNLISSIKFLVLDGQIKNANKTLSILAKLSRNTFNYSSKDQILLSEEIEFIKEYIVLHEIRIESKIEFNVSVIKDDNIEMDKPVYIPPFLIQPLVENSIEHGLKNLDREKKIWLNVAIKGSTIQIDVIDNGLGGIKNSTTRKDPDNIHSLDVVRQRIRLMKGGKENSFKTSDRYDENNRVCGSIASIFLVLINETTP